MGPLDKLGRWLATGENGSTQEIEPVVVSNLHGHNHRGKAFNVSAYFSGTPAAATRSIMLLLDDDHDVHLCGMNCVAGGEAVIHLYENPTVTASGTAQTPRTRNRTFVTGGVERSHTQAFLNPTVSNNGYVLEADMIPGLIGMEADHEIEWTLRRGGVYLVTLQNWNAGAKHLGIALDFYEEIYSFAIDGS